jgi:hypothetical protein
MKTASKRRCDPVDTIVKTPLERHPALHASSQAGGTHAAGAEIEIE